MDEINESLRLLDLEKKTDVSPYVIVSHEVERKTGFARGSLMSKIVNNLRNIKQKQPNMRIAIQNTTEDLDFYSYILNKVPEAYFLFDKEYAVKYSRNSIDEWTQFLSHQKTI